MTSLRSTPYKSLQLLKTVNLFKNPLTISDKRFFSLFGLNKNVFYYVLNEIGEALNSFNETYRIPVLLQLCIALRMLREGRLEPKICEIFEFELEASVVSEILLDVITVLNRIVCHKWIQLPTGKDVDQIESSFYKKYNVMGAIGVIGGFQVNIEPCTYSNVHNGNQSILNTIIMCSHDVEIIFADVSKGESVSDLNSQLDGLQKNVTFFYKNQDYDKEIYVDSGYSLQEWLVNPHLNKIKSFFSKDVMTNVTDSIETLKLRFQCLDSNHSLPYDDHEAKMIITACVALHNICIHYKAEYKL